MIPGLTDAILTWAASHPEVLLLLIFCISFLESLAIAGLIVPGVALLFGLATLAGHGQLSLLFCLPAAIAGAIAGDALSFYLGCHFRDQIWTIWPLNRDPGLRQRGEGFVRQHGGKSILIGRFVGPVRPVIPMVAGSLDMPPSRFLCFNVLSALGWGPFYFLPGYLAGAAIHLPTLTLHSPWLLAGSVALIATGAALVVAEIHLHLRSRPVQRLPSWQMVALVTGAAFLLWSALHVGAQVGQTLDESLHHFFSFRQPAFQGLFIALTLLGDPILLYPLFGIFLAMLAYQGHRRTAIIYLFGGLLLHAVTSLLKAWFALPRPPEALYPVSFAYPSGHASGAAFVYGLVALTLLSHHNRQINRAGMILAGFLIVMIASSRVYLNVHWLSDILGGLLLGTMMAAIAVGVARSREDARNARPFTPQQTASLLAIWCVTSVCHIVVRWSTALGQYPLPPAVN